MTTEKVRRATAEINSTIVMHPRFERAYHGILEIIETASYVDLPFGATVIGPPGCGKTALRKSISRAIPSSQLIGADMQSVHVSAEANATQGHFVSKLLKELGYPATVRASTLYNLSSLLASALRERGVKVVFIDEFQHVCRGKRDLSAAGITDWIKQLVDEGGVVVILLGTRELKPLVELNEQLGSRAPAYFELREFERNEEWIGFLRQLAESVKSFDLKPISEGLEKHLHAASQGRLRPLKQLLVAGAKTAIEAGKDVIDLPSLHDGYRKAFGADARVANPFTL